MRKKMVYSEKFNGAVSTLFIDSVGSLNSIKIKLVSKFSKYIAIHLLGENQRPVFSKLFKQLNQIHSQFNLALKSEHGDVPGWVLVVLMTTGLVTGIWTVAQPRLSSILKNSLDNMNSIR